MALVDVRQIIPGGIKATDHWHHIISDSTCSRCRRDVEADECPLLLWTDDRMDLLIYCEACLEERPHNGQEVKTH